MHSADPEAAHRSFDKLRMSDAPFSNRGMDASRKIPMAINDGLWTLFRHFFGDFLDSRLPWRSPFGPASLFARAPARVVCQQRKSPAL